MAQTGFQILSEGDGVGELLSEADAHNNGAPLAAGAGKSFAWRILAPAPIGVAALVGVAFLATRERPHSQVSPDAVTSLAEEACVASGGDCSKSHSCCEASDTCYKKNEFWASCQVTCDTDTPDALDGAKWSCEVLGSSGGGGDGDAAADLPKCPDVSDTECLQKKCSVSDGGAKGDCLKTWCCTQPGTQCFKQNQWWASCKASCNKSAGWSCDKLGPRTPGDSHAWQPCPRSKDAKEYPLLTDGDIGKAWDAAEQRAQELLQKLELEDKVALLRGQNEAWPNDRHGYAGYINPNFFFRNDCAMPLMLNDGPQGYNHYQKDLAGTTTQFPCLLAVAASFDPEVSREYAKAISSEFVDKGSNVMLGPDIEVGRNPLSGRSFETLSGEDPFLGSKLVAPFVQETLKKGIIVTVKHWLDNNEEDFRMTMDVNVSERAQHEIYMPVFKSAIDAGAGAIMCAYNKISGVHACENEHLLKKLLREDLGFRGFVMSDWGATHNAERSAKHGLDMEMPGGDDDEYHEIPELIKQGKLSENDVDKMASHVLSAMFASGHFDGSFTFDSGEADLDKNVTSDEHREVARKTIVESAVLLKNEGATLPLQKPKKIAMVGKYCKETIKKSYGQGDAYSGGGSGWVMTNLAVSPLVGLKAHFKDSEVTWSETVAKAESADVAVVCAAGHAEEGWDRANLTLPGASEMVVALRKASPTRKIVVLAIIPGAVTTEWVADADAVLALFMPGEQIGVAAAQLLDGTASPSGRLPVSLPAAAEERFTQQQYPGFPFNDNNMTANWSEGVLVGYRWNDAKKKSSAFPFGYGLAYTSFEFSDFKVDCATDGVKNVMVSMQVKNTGEREGAAVPQLYVSFKSLLPVVRQLRGFKKVQLAPGAMEKVQFELGSSDWSVWNEGKQVWVPATDSGEAVTITIGTSSADSVWSKEMSCLSPSVAINMKQ